MLKKCKKCGKNFETKEICQIYCSRKCAAEARRANNIKNRKCYACGKDFKTAFLGEKFCSEKCRIKFWRL